MATQPKSIENATNVNPLPETLAGALGNNGNYTHERDKLLERFRDRIAVNTALSRQLVSWQSNKQEAGFRWFKFKEGFSVALVRYLLGFLGDRGSLLDPFAGTGAAPITAASCGWEGTGIEILPVGVKIANGLRTAPCVDRNLFTSRAAELLEQVETAKVTDASLCDRFPHLRITEQAFPPDTERELETARSWLKHSEPGVENDLLGLAAISALEDASWTSKDGQYLRWDHRSGRNLKARMEKRCVLPYAASLRNRLTMVAADLPELAGAYNTEDVKILEGSCNEVLTDFPPNAFDAVITSPPYANRYDYTRTYALELAWLGYDDLDVSTLRQRLLSATVENRSKRPQLAANHEDALALFDRDSAVREITDALEEANLRGELPNPHVIRMVTNYFLEMTSVIVQLARVCRQGASVFMVNDNVQYHCQEVPVDLILSNLAEQCGFETKVIWTLPRGKGNASQQMGRFGRRELRKCVYWWVRR